MRIISEQELRTILEKHFKWAHGNIEDGERADLSDADLRGVNLSHKNLDGAILNDANLTGAILVGATFIGANLTRINLHGADLTTANLYGANLTSGYLKDTNLSNAILCSANLAKAYFQGANLFYADIMGANFYGADLNGALNIDYAQWNINTQFFSLQCPETGSFIGWKKAYGKIVKLEICEDALRSSATSRKCRCSKAKVLEIQNKDGSTCNRGYVHSEHDIHFIYKVGETVSVDNFDTNRWNECAPGIHFFITREEALKYI